MMIMESAIDVQEEERNKSSIRDACIEETDKDSIGLFFVFRRKIFLKRAEIHI